MSAFEKRRHEGRLRDSWQVPHKNRSRYKLNFNFRDGTTMSHIVAVPPPIEANLIKYRNEQIAANDGFIVQRPAVVNGMTTHKPYRLLKSVTAEFLGADV